MVRRETLGLRVLEGILYIFFHQVQNARPVIGNPHNMIPTRDFSPVNSLVVYYTPNTYLTNCIKHVYY